MTNFASTDAFIDYKSTGGIKMSVKLNSTLRNKYFDIFGLDEFSGNENAGVMMQWPSSTGSDGILNYFHGGQILIRQTIPSSSIKTGQLYEYSMYHDGINNIIIQSSSISGSIVWIGAISNVPPQQLYSNIVIRENAEYGRVTIGCLTSHQWDCIPARRLSDGVVGFLSEKDWSFHTSVGPVMFVAGPDTVEN